MNPASDRHVLASCSRDLTLFLDQVLALLDKRIRETDSRIQHIGTLKLRDEHKEREQATAQATRQLAMVDRQYMLIKGKHGLGWVSAPGQAFKAWRNQRQAEDFLARARDDFDEPELRAQRKEEIAAHNLDVEKQRQTLPSLSKSLQSDGSAHRQCTEFKNAAAAAMNAASGGGWLATDFGEKFRNISSLVRNGDLLGAYRLLPTLSFQKQPSPETYIRWEQYAQSVRDQAYSVLAGMSSTGGFNEIASASATLAARSMHAAPCGQLMSCSHPAEQWQLLSSLATSPRNFTVDVLWAIYWAMFQCAQQMAQFMDQTSSQEDPLNGRFSSYIENWLCQWAAQEIPKFGYPRSTSYLGTLQLAGTDEESRTGADLGIIISIDIGGLKCRKSALLQAKRARQGNADIGSSKGQLPKLSSLPKGGYYLFYHQSPSPLRPPVPTVSSAEALQQDVLAANKDPEARHLTQDVRKNGWDWASFVSFGLCNADSDLGEAFDTVEDALRILGSGDSGHLPRHLYLLAIADEPHVQALKKQLREHYQAIQPTHKKSHSRQLRASNSLSDPDQSRGDHGIER